MCSVCLLALLWLDVHQRPRQVFTQPLFLYSGEDYQCSPMQNNYRQLYCQHKKYTMLSRNIQCVILCYLYFFIPQYLGTQYLGKDIWLLFVKMVLVGFSLYALVRFWKEAIQHLRTFRHFHVWQGKYVLLYTLKLIRNIIFKLKYLMFLQQLYNSS